VRQFDPYDSLGFHCNLTYKAFVNTLKKRLKGTGASQVQYRALAHIITEEPISQAELADRLFITPATAVRLIDRMERDGWVVREQDASDGRIKRLVPTKKAAREWKEMSQGARAILEKAYRGLESSEIETVKRILERVRQNLET